MVMSIRLFEYQEEAIRFMQDRKKVYLAMGMGTGKTLTAISGAQRLGKKHTLVIAEKNEVVNSQNFAKEAGVLDIPYFNLRETKLQDVGDTRAVCGINPDALKNLDIETVWDMFDFVIVDESTMIKNITTARFRAVKKICNTTPYVVLLSGTPMMNGAAELYAPLLLLGHHLAGEGTRRDREAFEAIFAGGHYRKIRNTGVYWQDYTWWAKGANYIRELRSMCETNFYFLRKEDTTVFRMRPERKVVRIPMSVPWLIEYTQAWEKYFQEAEKKHRSLSPEEYLEKIDNIAGMQRIIENGQMYQVNSRWKARKVVEDIKAGEYGNQRIIVFTMFVETYELVCELLGDVGISYRTFDEVQEWKNGDEQVLVGRIKAHGKGGNCAEASVTLFVDMDFVPANNTQAENRMDRPEQKNDMTIVYYLTQGDDTVDAHVRRINQTKTQRIENFMRPLHEQEVLEMPVKIKQLVRKFPKQAGILNIKETVENSLFV